MHALLIMCYMIMYAYVHVMAHHVAVGPIAVEVVEMRGKEEHRAMVMGRQVQPLAIGLRNLFRACLCVARPAMVLALG